jgi:uncharacterized protein YcbK (DUF882 family)
MRRRGVVMGLAAAVARGVVGIGPLPCLAAGGVLSAAKRAAALPATRVLRLRHVDERMAVEEAFMVDGQYDVDAVARLCLLMRDRHANVSTYIDVKLFQRLWWLQESLELREPIVLLSGYRSKATNDWLRSMSEGVAEKSLHIVGEAADVQFPGWAPDTLRRVVEALATTMGSGGCGFYGWGVHVDVGEKRTWRG